MKRWIACITLSVALAAPASASALSVYGGDGAEDPEMKVFFGVKKKEDKRKRVKAFTAFSVPFTCSDGSPGRTGDALPLELPERMRVNERRRFRGREKFDAETTNGTWQVKMAVKGKLKRAGRAKGVLSISGPGPHDTICESGEVDWIAAKVPKD